MLSLRKRNGKRRSISAIRDKSFSLFPFFFLSFLSFQSSFEKTDRPTEGKGRKAGDKNLHFPFHDRLKILIDVSKSRRRKTQYNVKCIVWMQIRVVHFYFNLNMFCLPADETCWMMKRK